MDRSRCTGRLRECFENRRRWCAVPVHAPKLHFIATEVRCSSRAWKSSVVVAPHRCNSRTASRQFKRAIGTRARIRELSRCPPPVPFIGRQEGLPVAIAGPEVRAIHGRRHSHLQTHPHAPLAVTSKSRQFHEPVVFRRDGSQRIRNRLGPFAILQHGHAWSPIRIQRGSAPRIIPRIILAPVCAGLISGHPRPIIPIHSD